MDSQNIHGIILQLKLITEGVDKIAKGVNNSWTVWVPLIIPSIVALLLGVAGIFQDRIRYWFYKPKLVVVIVNYHLKQGRINGSDSYHNFLFKIENIGKSSMEDVEVLIKEIWKLKEKSREGIDFIPLKLKWKNYGSNLTMPKIPSFVYEYADFGYVDKPIESEPLLIKFQIDNSAIELYQGRYEIKIRFSANNIEPEEITYNLEIKNTWVDDGKNIKEMLSIEEC
ncbi:MAG: hypothetical protein M1576_01415 [Deltaproteobacteria bacterium]|nr:hypothetical protein [Deltaproteobacteria bacterium]